MDAGCIFRHKYRVAALSDFDTVSLSESSATMAPRIYSTVTSRITWPLAGHKGPWEFPLLSRYVYENETSLGRVYGVPGHRGGLTDTPLGPHESRGLPPSSSTSEVIIGE